MNAPLEAAGDVMTGGVIAAALEPERGGKRGQRKLCLNCGTALAGGYCHACGQPAHVHRSLAGLWHDIAHGVFHFEGKIARTLPMLAWRPGELTRRYVHGERARFVSPLALFLFSVFLMFAVFETVGGPIRPNYNRDGVSVGSDALKADLLKARAKMRTLEAERTQAIAKGVATARIDEQLQEARRDIDGLAMATNMLSGDVIDNLPATLKVKTFSPQMDERVKAAIKNPKLLLYKMQSSAYKFAWALIPLSLPFMWLLFASRRHYRLYDHAIFVTYSISAVMLLLIAMALLASVGIGPSLLLLLIPVHFYRQLKQAYALHGASAAWRTVALLLISATVLAAFGITLLALGLSG